MTEIISGRVTQIDACGHPLVQCDDGRSAWVAAPAGESVHCGDWISGVRNDDREPFVLASINRCAHGIKATAS